MLISFFGCKPEENSLPKIEIAKPVAQETFVSGDTMAVHFSVSDDELVVSYLIELLNEKGETVTSESGAVGESQKDVKVGFPIQPIYIEQGNYVLQVTAFDKEASGIATVAISVVQARREKTYYLTQSGLNLTLVDTSFNEISFHSFNDSIESYLVNHRNERYFVHLSNGVIECRTLPSHELMWSSSNLEGVPKTISKYAMGGTLLYMIGTGGRLIAVDILGRLISTSALSEVIHLYAEEDWEDVLALSERLFILDGQQLIVQSSQTIETASMLAGHYPVTYVLRKDGDKTIGQKRSITNNLNVVSTYSIQQSIDQIEAVRAFDNGLFVLSKNEVNLYSDDELDALLLPVPSTLFIEKDPLYDGILILTIDGVYRFGNSTPLPKKISEVNNLDRIFPVYNF